MEKFYKCRTTTTPEIHFSPEENIFLISGTSAPEDVRAMYYPVIEWINLFVEGLTKSDNTKYSSESPLKFQVDLVYFNSSSAKFLFDIFAEFRKLSHTDIPFVVEWVYDKEDSDLKDAGIDISSLLEMEFSYIPKTR